MKEFTVFVDTYKFNRYRKFFNKYNIYTMDDLKDLFLKHGFKNVIKTCFNKEDLNIIYEACSLTPPKKN